jgi:tetratricopeptide (TPR) repeat protein
MRAIVGSVLIILFSSLVCRASFDKLRQLTPASINDESQSREVLYLPSGEALELVSFGYRNVLADLLWFNTVNYFGKHYSSDQNYRWLFHMCDLVTTLDPQATHVYEFASIMLGWEMNLPDQAIKILDKAIKHQPNYWRHHYLRGFTYMFFKSDTAQAHRDFVTASKLPDAHYIAARLAAKNLAAGEDPEEAIRFLQETITVTKDPHAKDALTHRLNEARYELDMRRLEQARDIFKQSAGRDPATLEELVSAGIIAGLPPDPFGGKYFIEGSEIKSTSGQKRLKRYKRPGQQ